MNFSLPQSQKQMKSSFLMCKSKGGFGAGFVGSIGSAIVAVVWMVGKSGSVIEQAPTALDVPGMMIGLCKCPTFASTCATWQFAYCGQSQTLFWSFQCKLNGHGILNGRPWRHT